MSNAVVPSLSGAGWVKDPKLQLDTMFAYALVCDYSQSTIYGGSITSIPYIIATYMDDISELCSQLESSLFRYYQRVFSTVQVDVTNTTTDGVSYALYISVVVTSAGQSYSLAVTGTVDNGALNNVITRLNQ